MTDAATGLSILHVIVRAGPTNSQYNEHCLPVLDSRRVTVCSLFPADVQPPDQLALFEGDGTVGGCFRALRRTLAAEEYDIVHVHAPASGIVTLLTYLKLRRPRRDLAFTVHNSWSSFRVRNRLFLRLILALFPLVVVCGQAAFESMPQRLRRRDNVHVVPNGVDVDRIDKVLDGNEPEARDGFHVITVSRLIPIKHPHTALSAFISMRKARDTLVVVGDGTLRNQLDDRVQHDGLLRQVSMKGVIPRDDVYRELDRADAFMTTSAGEGLPVALLEAMACGLPVVASDIPPHREVARVAQGLPLVPVGDTEGFARALTRIKTAGPEQRDRMGQRLRACVEEHFSVRSMNEAYGQLYRSRVPRGGEVGRPLRSATLLEAPASLFDRVKHRLALILTLSILGAAAGFGIAYVQAPVFKGETSLQVGRDLGVAADENTLKTSGALAIRYADLSRREPVLGPLVEEGWAESWRDLQRDVFARVGDKNPQLVEISVYTDDRERSAELASAVADSLLRAARAAIDSDTRFFLRGQVSALEADIASAETEVQRLRERLPTVTPQKAPALRDRIADLQATLGELRSSYVELDAMDTSESGRLAIVDPAWTTRSPLRPTPLVLAVAGLAIGFTLALGWIHLFDRRPPERRPTEGPTQSTVPEQPRARDGHARASAWAGTDPMWRHHDLERR